MRTTNRRLEQLDVAYLSPVPRMSKALLQILASQDGLTLSEVAGRLWRQTSASRDYLRRLMEVHLLIEREGRYFYADPVFRYGVAQTTQGLAVEGFLRRKNSRRWQRGWPNDMPVPPSNSDEPRKARCGGCCASWPAGPGCAPIWARSPCSRCQHSHASSHTVHRMARRRSMSWRRTGAVGGRDKMVAEARRT